MEIINNTNDDAKVKVSGGGSGMVETKEEMLSLPAGRSISHTPRAPGPWRVAFYVGDRQAHKTVQTATGKVTLVREGNNGYRAAS